MSRASRTAELLAALQLAPFEVEREQVRARQQNASSRAIASLVPALIEGGASIAGDVIGAQKADALQVKKDARDERDALARIASRDTANNIAKTRADAAAAKAEADKAKAAADTAESKRKADEAAAKSAKEATAAGIEAGVGSAAATLPTGGKRRVVGTFRPGESPLDEVERLQAESGSNLPLEQLGGMVDRQALEDRKNLAQTVTAERKANAPTGPKPPNPMQALRDEKLRLEVEQLRGKPGAAAAAQARDDAKLTTAQQEDVANIVASRRALKRITDEAAKVDPNLLSAAKNAALTTIGIDDKLTNYVAEVRNFNSAVGAMRSGASIGVAEQKRLDSFLVAPQDTIGTVEQKRRAFEEYLQDKEAGINAARRAQNLPAANLGEGPMKPASEMTDEEIQAELDAGAR